MKEETLCHPAEEVQVQGVPVAGVAAPAVGAAVHQEEGAVRHIALIAAPVRLIEAPAAELHQRIFLRELGGINLPVCHLILRPNRFW